MFCNECLLLYNKKVNTVTISDLNSPAAWHFGNRRPHHRPGLWRAVWTLLHSREPPLFHILWNQFETSGQGIPFLAAFSEAYSLKQNLAFPKARGSPHRHPSWPSLSPPPRPVRAHTGSQAALDPRNRRGYRAGVQGRGDRACALQWPPASQRKVPGGWAQRRCTGVRGGSLALSSACCRVSW